MGIKRNDFAEQILPAPIRGIVSGFSTCQETGASRVHLVAEDGQEFVLPIDQVRGIEQEAEEGEG